MRFIVQPPASLGAQRNIWFVEGMITPGFNIVSGRKAMGKTFFLLQMADAIAEGRDFLGSGTAKAKVLPVSFELDEKDTADRFRERAPLSRNAHLLHTWSKGEEAFADAEEAMTALGFRVIIFDTFLPLIPDNGQFRLNEYGDSAYYDQQARHDGLPCARVIREEEPQGLPRQHLLICRRDLVRQGFDQGGVHRQHRVKQVGQLDAVGLRDEPEQRPIRVETPRPTRFGDFQPGLIVAVENLVPQLAFRGLVGQFDGR